MKHLLLLSFLFFVNDSYGQKTKDYLVSYTDSTSGEDLIGYKDKFGKIRIQAKFPLVYTDTFYNMAIVLQNGEWIGIDQNQNTILKPFIFDNGPDYLEEGLFRFVENEKIGFADTDGRKVIAAKYDFATPFENGLAAFTIGGHRTYEKGAEHWWWTGGYDSGYVNQQGMEFSKVSALKQNKREVWTKDKRHYVLNNRGHLLKEVK